MKCKRWKRRNRHKVVYTQLSVLADTPSHHYVWQYKAIMIQSGRVIDAARFKRMIKH